MTRKKVIKTHPDQQAEKNADPISLHTKLSLNPSYTAAAAMEPYAKIFGDVDVGELTLHLDDKTEALAKGDLSRAEAMLFNQAHALQAIFTNLSRRAIAAEYMDNLDRYLRLALKAQAQCTRTIEVLGALKNPSPVAFVKQANIGQAVQVNNDSASHARENLNPTNELLEKKDEQRLDTRTTTTTISVDPFLEPMEQINRPKNSNR